MGCKRPLFETSVMLVVVGLTNGFCSDQSYGEVGTGDWGLGTGDWGLGTGDWGLGTGDWGLGTGDSAGTLLPARRLTRPLPASRLPLPGRLASRFPQAASFRSTAPTRERLPTPSFASTRSTWLRAVKRLTPSFSATS